jgi:L,D-transpeptidase ErfK/SrfK
MKKLTARFFLSPIITWVLCLPAYAQTFPLSTDKLIGAMQITQANEEDTLVDIARRFDLGYEEMLMANPSVDAWMPGAGTQVVIPSLYLLPLATREGIIVNIAEMRLYYFHKAKKGEPRVVETHPISVGRGDWSTPIITTKVTKKMVDPVWYPPKTIRDEHAAEGDILPTVVPAGAGNPLGKYALYLSTSSYLIHGTNKEYGIGMQVTHGCMRLYPEDIEQLYNNVPVGTRVQIINQPYKVAWHNGDLYIEVHPWLEGTPEKQIEDNHTLLEELIIEALSENPTYQLDWEKVKLLKEKPNGIPTIVGAN